MPVTPTQTTPDLTGNSLKLQPQSSNTASLGTQQNPIKMTRAEYQTKYGQAPAIPQSTTALGSQNNPIPMTHAEYMTKYGNQQPEQIPQDNWSAIMSPTAAPINDLGAGVLKGLGTGADSLGKMGNSLLDNTVGRVINKFQGKGFTPTDSASQGDLQKTGLLDTQNTTQAVGKAGEQFAEFLAPETAISKLTEVPKITKTVFNLAKDVGVAGLQSDGNLGTMLTTGLTSGILRGLPLAADIPGVKNTVLNISSKLSGYAPSLLQKALERTPGTVDAAKNGEQVLVDAVKKTAVGISDYSQQLLQESRAKVAELDAISGGGRGYPGTRQAIVDEGRKFVGNMTNYLRQSYNIGVQKDGGLVFDRGSLPSNIVSGGDQKAIQSSFDTMRNILNDTSISNIDANLERMLSLYKKTPVGTPTGPETKSIIHDMMDEVVKFTGSLGKISKAYPEYAQFVKQNIPARAFINDAKEIFGSTRNLSPKETTLITSRLLQLFNAGKTDARNFAETVGKKVGTDITGSSAGSLIHGIEQSAVTAHNIMNPARSLVTKTLEALPRGIIKNYIRTGNLTTLEQHPTIQAIASTLRISAIDVAKEIGNLISPNSNE